MKTIKTRILMLVAALAMGTIAGNAAMAATPSSASQGRIARQVRHELVTLPYYGVFDNLAYKVEGDSVTLYGQVVRPTTRSDAQARVARIAGVSHVVNNISVLPLSSFDNSIRVRSYQAIARMGGLNRYLSGTNPSLHIIVSGGRITLEGVVDSQGDRQLAYTVANQISGVFSVTNNLRLEKEMPS